MGNIKKKYFLSNFKTTAGSLFGVAIAKNNYIWRKLQYSFWHLSSIPLVEWWKIHRSKCHDKNPVTFENEYMYEEKDYFDESQKSVLFSLLFSLFIDLVCSLPVWPIGSLFCFVVTMHICCCMSETSFERYFLLTFYTIS